MFIYMYDNTIKYLITIKIISFLMLLKSNILKTCSRYYVHVRFSFFFEITIK